MWVSHLNVIEFLSFYLRVALLPGNSRPVVLSGAELELQLSWLRAASKLKFIATEPLEIPSAFFGPWSLASLHRHLDLHLHLHGITKIWGQARAGQCKRMVLLLFCLFLARPTGRVCGSHLLLAVFPLVLGLLLDKKCDVSPLETADDDGASEIGNRELGISESGIGDRESPWLPVSLGFSLPASDLVTCHQVARAKRRGRLPEPTPARLQLVLDLLLDLALALDSQLTRSFWTCLPPSEIYGLDKREKLQMLMQRQPLQGASLVQFAFLIRPMDVGGSESSSRTHIFIKSN